MPFSPLYEKEKKKKEVTLFHEPKEAKAKPQAKILLECTSTPPGAEIWIRKK